MSDWLQVVIAGLIIAFVLYAIFWRGTQNPVGTGALQKQLNTIGSELRALATRVDDFCSSAELEALRNDVERIEKAAASSAEMIALEGKINVLGERVEGWGGATRRVEGMVQRIEGILVKKALSGE